MRLIDVPLSQGFVAKISEEDADLILSKKWHAAYCGKKPYARRCEDARPIYMHRLIMGLGKGRSPVVDHINGDTLNNSRINLRVVSVSENIQNSRNARAKVTMRRGVFVVRDSWMARIKFFGETVYLGLYKTKEEAAAAYDGAAIALYGMDAFLNSDIPI